MTVSSSTSLTSMAQNTTGATQKSAASMAQTYDQFLKLLTTQLKNQDPLSPMDTNQMTNQLVQFSQVEQQIAMNDKLDKMLSQSKVSATLNAAGFIDKVIEATGSYAILDSTEPNASGKFTVGLDADAEKSSVIVKNADGEVVRSLEFVGKKGRNTITWDGKDKHGRIQPDGAYNVSVNALDADKKEVKSAVSTIGKVTDVVVDEKGAAKLSLHGAQVGLDSIVQIKKTS